MMYSFMSFLSLTVNLRIAKCFDWNIQSIVAALFMESIEQKHKKLNKKKRFLKEREREKCRYRFLLLTKAIYEG